MMHNNNKQHILVVDDDRRICRFLQRFLASEGYTVTCVEDGRAMRRTLADEDVDLIILDLSFPSGEDGVTLARHLRAQNDLPLIVLSGKDTTIDKVVCLELGADDYVTKPFEPRELLARIRSVMRRWAKGITLSDPAETNHSTVMSFAGWRLDRSRHQLSSPKGEKVRLTGREFQLLAALVERRGRVLSREQILDIVANRYWTPYDRSIDVTIGKIRRKLRDSARDTRFIKTVRGVGYMFAPQLEE